MDHHAISQILATWTGAPRETEAEYFQVWQRAAVEMQNALRVWIPEIYFAPLERFENRGDAYSMIVYAASRPCYGKPRTEFTYFVPDPETLNLALRSIGSRTRRVLAPIEKRLRESGRADLALRYLPVWHEDIVRAARKKPGMLIDLLAADARLVNAVIDLGAAGNIARFQRAATLALRSVAGLDIRGLAIRALELAGRVVAPEGAVRG
ncbi:MAG TPA: hypothetical protein VKX39_12290 [Bryobacteraceae bacterium]|jgi:hypothetical protein|nr:hypothetical protein [Bryobacteraceae bacterium]